METLTVESLTTKGRLVIINANGKRQSLKNYGDDWGQFQENGAMAKVINKQGETLGVLFKGAHKVTVS